MTGVEVRFSRVNKMYLSGEGEPVTALADVSFSVPAGATVAVTGPSGSGKSTLLHIAGAMDTADSGEITVGGQDVHALRGNDVARYRRGVGVVFQRFHLLSALSVLDNVLAPVLPIRTAYDKEKRGRELLEDVGLSGRENDLPSRLSGGQQQRVAIARALIAQPGILLADEPTGNLDSANGLAILDLLDRMRIERAFTTLIATHDPLVASRCDRLLRLRDGRIVHDSEIPPTDAARAAEAAMRLDLR
jgi:putative ABC transport system ATP-binding protein